ncbi:MAG: tRNA 2-thiocytidine biosynthesis protein TtcA [Clostridia bacterium]|nr:tRNA 2-thiocytidine biosynthesis protein TtcA [Clostridia bacterium]MBN2882811.1 tRNA 2-thiocytidine biosynthesis protein TtcA [Clostridia bacterium]
MSDILEGQIRKYLKAYNAIKKGDKICVGVSGGKDSMVLLHALSSIREYLSVPFDIYAVTVSLGFEGFDTSPVFDLCRELNVPFNVVETQIGKIVFDARTEENPCSLCANMRRGALNNAAVDLGCNKVALGHNRDDLLETYLMALFYEGRMHTFSPITYLSKKDIEVIRPLSFSYSKDVRYYRNIHDIPTVKNPCPADKDSKRKEIRKLIKTLSMDNPHFKANVIGAIIRNKIGGW